MRHIASSHSFEPKYHVFPVPFLSPIVPSLPECDLNISSTHKTWPALFSGVKDLYPPFYGDPAFETSSHPTPSPQLSYPPLWSFLYLTSSGSPHFFHWKERGLCSSFRRSRKIDTRSNMNNVESWWGVSSFSKTSHGEPSSHIDSLSPCFFPGPSSFPWPLPSNQTL